MLAGLTTLARLCFFTAVFLTFIGAGELARESNEPPEILRQRVTSKGGTTYAAITSMEQDDIKGRFMKALKAAQVRAKELGDEFGDA